MHNVQLHDLYCSPNIIPVIRTRKTRWAEHVAVWRRGEVHAEFWWGNLRETDHLEDLGVDVRIILKWFLKNSVRVHGLA